MVAMQTVNTDADMTVHYIEPRARLNAAHFVSSNEAVLNYHHYFIVLRDQLEYLMRSSRLALCDQTQGKIRTVGRFHDYNKSHCVRMHPFPHLKRPHFRQCSRAALVSTP